MPQPPLSNYDGMGCVRPLSPTRNCGKDKGSKFSSVK